jgi:hypothetical protein
MYLNAFLSLVSDTATVVLWWSSCRALLYYTTYRKKTLLLLSPLFQRVSTRERERERERESLKTFNSANSGAFCSIDQPAADQLLFSFACGDVVAVVGEFMNFLP